MMASLTSVIFVIFTGAGKVSCMSDAQATSGEEDIAKTITGTTLAFVGCLFAILVLGCVYHKHKKKKMETNYILKSLHDRQKLFSPFTKQPLTLDNYFDSHESDESDIFWVDVAHESSEKYVSDSESDDKVMDDTLTVKDVITQSPIRALTPNIFDSVLVNVPSLYEDNDYSDKNIFAGLCSKSGSHSFASEGSLCHITNANNEMPCSQDEQCIIEFETPVEQINQERKVVPINTKSEAKRSNTFSVRSSTPEDKTGQTSPMCEIDMGEENVKERSIGDKLMLNVLNSTGENDDTDSQDRDIIKTSDVPAKSDNVVDDNDHGNLAFLETMITELDENENQCDRITAISNECPSPRLWRHKINNNQFHRSFSMKIVEYRRSTETRKSSLAKFRLKLLRFQKSRIKPVVEEKYTKSPENQTESKSLSVVKTKNKIKYASSEKRKTPKRMTPRGSVHSMASSATTSYPSPLHRSTPTTRDALENVETAISVYSNPRKEPLYIRDIKKRQSYPSVSSCLSRTQSECLSRDYQSSTLSIDDINFT